MRRREPQAAAFLSPVRRLAQAVSGSKPLLRSDTQHQPFGPARASLQRFQTSRTGCEQLTTHSSAGLLLRSLRGEAVRNSKRNSLSLPRDNYALHPTSIRATTLRRPLLRFESPLDRAATAVSTLHSAGYVLSTRPRSPEAASTDHRSCAAQRPPIPPCAEHRTDASACPLRH